MIAIPRMLLWGRLVAQCHLVFGQDRCGARTPACRVGTRADAWFEFGALGVTCRFEAKEHMSFKMFAREKTKRHWASSLRPIVNRPWSV